MSIKKLNIKPRSNYAIAKDLNISIDIVKRVREDNVKLSYLAQLDFMYGLNNFEVATGYKTANEILDSSDGFREFKRFCRVSNARQINYRYNVSMQTAELLQTNVVEGLMNMRLSYFTRLKEHIYATTITV